MLGDKTDLFPIDQDWVEMRPARVKRTRIYEAIISIIVLVAATFWGAWALAIATALIAGYWILTFNQEVRFNWALCYIETNNSGLKQSFSKVSGEEAIVLFTSWKNLELVDYRESDGQVSRIRIRDKSLPKRSNIFVLENYRDMSKLYNTIKNRIEYHASE